MTAVSTRSVFLLSTQCSSSSVPLWSLQLIVSVSVCTSAFILMLGVMSVPFPSWCPSHTSPDVVLQPTLQHTTRQTLSLNNQGHTLLGFSWLLSPLCSNTFFGDIKPIEWRLCLGEGAVLVTLLLCRVFTKAFFFLETFVNFSLITEAHRLYEPFQNLGWNIGRVVLEWHVWMAH